jgi:hypothetical protein
MRVGFKMITGMDHIAILYRQFFPVGFWNFIKIMMGIFNNSFRIGYGNNEGFFAGIPAIWRFL